MDGQEYPRLRNRLFPLFLLAASRGVFNILFLCTVFYVPFQTVFGFNNLQMGSLMGVYAVFSTPANLFNGILTDRFNPKIMLVLATSIAGVCGFCLSAIPNYTTTLIIMSAMSVPCALLQWAPYTRCVGLMGTGEEQGRLFGISDMFNGLLSCFLFIFLAFAFGDALSTRAGFRIIILIFSAFYFLAGIGILLFYDYKKWKNLSGGTEKNGASGKFTFRSIGEAMRQPIVWIVSLLIIGMYMASTCLGYLSPYLSAAFIMPASLAAAFGSIVRYGVQTIASPIGGTLRDKVLKGNTPYLIWLCSALGIMAMTGFLLIPKRADLTMPAVIIALIVVFFYRMSKSAEGSSYRQLRNVPQHLMGTIIGLSCTLGYCTDLFLPTTIGRILDGSGVNGYRTVFIIFMLGMGISSLGGLWLNHEMKKECAVTEEERRPA